MVASRHLRSAFGEGIVALVSVVFVQYMFCRFVICFFVTTIRRIQEEHETRENFSAFHFVCHSPLFFLQFFSNRLSRDNRAERELENSKLFALKE